MNHSPMNGSMDAATFVFHVVQMKSIAMRMVGTRHSTHSEGKTCTHA